MPPLIVVPRVLREKLGEDGAAALVELFNQAQNEWKNDVIALVEEKFERRLSEELGALRLEIEQLRAEMRESYAALRAEMRESNAALRQEMSENDAALRQEMAEHSAALRQEMAQMETRLREEMNQMEVRLRGEMSQMEVRLREEVVQNTASLRVEVERMRAELDRKFTILFVVLFFTVIFVNQNALEFLARILGLLR